MPFPLEIAVASLVMAVGCSFQAAFGIGMALIVVPALALIDTRFVPGPILFAGMALAAATAYRDRAAINYATLNLSLLGLGIGTAAGAFALQYFAGPYLPKVFGALILLAAVMSAAGARFSPRPKMLLAGSIASGIMGTMVGIHGPAIALVFQNEKLKQTRAILGAFFLVGYAIAVISLALVGLFGFREVVLGLGLLPGVAIGYFAAPTISQFINQALLRAAILTVSSISGILMLFR
jgi:uncharacterized protein